MLQYEQEKHSKLYLIESHNLMNITYCHRMRQNPSLILMQLGIDWRISLVHTMHTSIHISIIIIIIVLCIASITWWIVCLDLKSRWSLLLQVCTPFLIQFHHFFCRWNEVNVSEVKISHKKLLRQEPSKGLESQNSPIRGP